MDNPETVKYFMSLTLPPGECPPKNSLFDGLRFMGTLAIAIGLKEDGKLLLESLKEKWSEAVENSMQEATEYAEESLRQAALFP